MRLRLVGVHCRGVYPFALEMPNDPIGAVFRACEHENRLHRLALEEIREQAALPLPRNRIDVVRDGVRRRRSAPDLHDDGLAQILSRQRFDLGRHRRAEQQRLPICWDITHDTADLRCESHVEHAIGFVEHEHLEIIERHVLALEMIDETPWRRDDHVHSGAQLLFLRLQRNAAIHGGDRYRRVASVLPEARFDLDA